MYENELAEKSWKMSDNVKRVEFEITGIATLEQELGILRLRAGLKDESKPEIKIHCSDQTMITELSKSEYFTLEEYEVSSHERNKGFILCIKGKLATNGLTIRKKIPTLSESERLRRSERAKIVLSK